MAKDTKDVKSDGGANKARKCESPEACDRPAKSRVRGQGPVLCIKHYQRALRTPDHSFREVHRPKAFAEPGNTTSVVLPRLTEALLRDHAAKRGVSVGVIVREALDEYFLAHLTGTEAVEKADPAAYTVEAAPRAATTPGFTPGTLLNGHHKPSA